MNTQEFIKACEEIVAKETQKEISIQEGSFRICQLCIEHDKSLFPEYDELMNIACDLEVPTEYRDRPLDDWEKLKGIVNRGRDGSIDTI